MWGEMAGFGEEQLETIHKGGYFTKLVQPGFRVLSYNSNYGSVQFHWPSKIWAASVILMGSFCLHQRSPENFYNLLNEDGKDYYEMQNFIRDTLQTARDNKEKVDFYPSISWLHRFPVNPLISAVGFTSWASLHWHGWHHGSPWEIHGGDSFSLQRRHHSPHHGPQSHWCFPTGSSNLNPDLQGALKASSNVLMHCLFPIDHPSLNWRGLLRPDCNSIRDNQDRHQSLCSSILSGPWHTGSTGQWNILPRPWQIHEYVRRTSVNYLLLMVRLLVFSVIRPHSSLCILEHFSI